MSTHFGFDFDITERPIPSWYELSVSPAPHSIIISIHRSMYEIILRELVPGKPLFRDYLLEGMRHRRIELPEFTPPNNSNWGFGKMVTWQDAKDPDWIDLVCPLPDKNFTADFNPIYAICGTLKSLFSVLNMSIVAETNSSRYQLITIDSWDGSIHLSAEVTRWINRKGEQDPITNIPETMLAIAAFMSLCKDDPDNVRYGGFWAVADPPRHLYLNYFGNACGLAPEICGRYGNSQEFMDKGIKLVQQNVDHLTQWFILVIGVILIGQSIRAEKEG